MGSFELLKLALAGLGLGLLGYAFGALAYAWRSKKADGGSVRQGLREFTARGAHRCSQAIGLLGFTGILLAFVLWVVIDRDGVLFSEALFTLRAPPGLDVTHLAEQNTLQAGDFVAQFRSPSLEAEREVLKLRKSSLENGKRIATAEPLEVDPKIVRRQQELEANLRHLQDMLERMTAERDDVLRDQVKTRLTKREQIVELGGGLGRLQMDLEQALAELQVSRRDFSAGESLRRSGLISGEDYDKRGKQLEIRAAEVEKLRRQQTSKQHQLAELEQGLRDVERVLDEQATALAEQTARTRGRLARAGEELESLAAERAADLARAETRRGEQLEQLESELKQCESKLAGLRQALTIEAPFGGRILYRNPSPQTVHTDDPLIVLAPPGAFVLRVRLPAAQLTALREAGTVSLELLEPPGNAEDDSEWRSAPHLVRRFPGRLVGSRSLEQEPSMVLAEIVCDPPPEAVRDHAAGKPIEARLRWLPPLWSLPSFVVGVGLLVTAMLGSFTVGRKRVPSAPPRPAGEPLPGPRAGIFQLESDGSAIRLLGAQLRDAIAREELDVALIGTIEWAIDRGGVRTVDLLREGLEDPLDIGKPLDDLLRSRSDYNRSNGRNGGSGGSGANGANGSRPGHAADARERLLGLLRLIVPTLFARPADFELEPPGPPEGVQPALLTGMVGHAPNPKH